MSLLKTRKPFTQNINLVTYIYVIHILHPITFLRKDL